MTRKRPSRAMTIPAPPRPAWAEAKERWNTLASRGPAERGGAQTLTVSPRTRLLRALRRLIPYTPARP